MSRVKIEYRNTAKSNYLKFKAKYPQHNITYDQFEAILKEYSFSLRDYMLQSGQPAKVMWGMGEFQIYKYKKKLTTIDSKGVERINLAINWKETKRTGKYVYYTNYHTDGYNYHWCWNRHASMFYFRNIWSFKPCRLCSRMLAAQLKADPLFCQIYKSH